MSCSLVTLFLRCRTFVVVEIKLYECWKVYARPSSLVPAIAGHDM